MKKYSPLIRSVLPSFIMVTTLLLAMGPANAAANPIRQRQQNQLLGHRVQVLERGYQGIGARSGLLTNTRIITRNAHATPDFIIEGPPYTTTPVDRPTGVASPNNYGVPGNLAVRIYVRVNNTYVTVNPFETPRANALHQVRQAQRRWLRDNGYAGAARLVRRVDVSAMRTSEMMTQNETASSKELPTPRATIEIHPNGPKQSTETPALEASKIEREPARRIVLSSHDLEEVQAKLAASINGTITVRKTAKIDLKLATTKQ